MHDHQFLQLALQAYRQPLFWSRLTEKEHKKLLAVLPSAKRVNDALSIGVGLNLFAVAAVFVMSGRLFPQHLELAQSALLKLLGLCLSLGLGVLGAVIVNAWRTGPRVADLLYHLQPLSANASVRELVFQMEAFERVRSYQARVLNRRRQLLQGDFGCMEELAARARLDAEMRQAGDLERVVSGLGGLSGLGGQPQPVKTARLGRLASASRAGATSAAQTNWPQAA